MRVPTICVHGIDHGAVFLVLWVPLKPHVLVEASKFGTLARYRPPLAKVRIPVPQPNNR